MSIANALFVGKITPKMLMEEGWRPQVWVDSQLRRIHGWYRWNRQAQFFSVRVDSPKPQSVESGFSLSGDSDLEWGGWKKDETATDEHRDKLNKEILKCVINMPGSVIAAEKR